MTNLIVIISPQLVSVHQKIRLQRLRMCKTTIKTKEIIMNIIVLTDKQSSNILKRMVKFNLTVEEFLVMWNDQQGRCKICETEMLLFGTSNRSRCIDHNHRTGKIRSLLCQLCNKTVGHLERWGFDRLEQKLIAKKDHISLRDKEKVAKCLTYLLDHI